jgi:hypothetical protein
MLRFSRIFNIDKAQAELDFVDITPGADIPLYIDPYALTTREDDWSIASHELVVSFFQEVLNSIKSKDERRGIQLLSHLGEPEETHLGVSKEGNRGRGIGSVQAAELYNSLRKSRAAKSALLEDLSDFALFIGNIGRDKISDITTNVIRKTLIDYTQSQCFLYNIPMRKVSSGFYWCINTKEWIQGYVELPVYDNSKILLAPKHTVRYQVGVDHTRYRKMFVLEYLKGEHLRADDGLVTTLRDKKGKLKKKVVYKKTLDLHYPTSKDFLAEFSSEHPEVIDKYRDSLKELASRIPDINGENYQESVLALSLKEHLIEISTGAASANEYHDFCLSAISFLFFPNLIYPKKEQEINQGRKRIDITYTNGKDFGFFYRIATDKDIKANTIHIECKNYTNDIKNPEVDQLLGRFDQNRGRFGMLFFRNSDNFIKLKQRCKDVAKQSIGIILPIDDSFILRCLSHVEGNDRKKIDMELEKLYQNIIS